MIKCQSTDQESHRENNSLNLNKDLTSETGLSENHDRLDLSLESLEKQNKDKAEAAKKLAEAREKRLVIETKMPANSKQNVNVAFFARSTSNKKGQSIYSRNSYKIFDHWTECSHFSTDDSAQRFFLELGGPEMDSKNLDPDGDGFACNWDPVLYRQFIIPNE